MSTTPGHPPTLDYRNPFALRRPSSLTTMGTLSLVYGTGSFLLSAFASLSDVGRLIAMGVTVVPTTTGPTTAPAVPLVYHYNPTVLAIALGADVCSFALAVLLLVAGVQTIRDRVIAARLHWMFAVIKMPISILSMGASWIIATGMMRDMNAWISASVQFAVPRSTFSFLQLPSLIAAIVACGYSIVLLIVLRSEAVRRYYEGVRRGTQ